MSELQLVSTIGFSGHVKGGLVAHPNGKHIIYPLGSILIVMEKGKPTTQRFLSGHIREISAVTVSYSGKYIASGESSPLDHEAQIILWDFAELKLICQWQMHKDSVKCLAFSKGDRFLASLGGDDRIVVWDVQNRKGMTGVRATLGSTGNANVLSFFKTDETRLVSAGGTNIRSWKIDEKNVRLAASEVKLDQVKREVTCIECDERDQAVYCGTTTGDVLKIDLKAERLAFHGPKKMLGEGVTSLKVSPWGDIVVGSGCGILSVLAAKDLAVLASTQLAGKVTSVSIVPETNEEILVGTSESDIVAVSTDAFKPKVLSKGHSSSINDVFFPERSSLLFATCSTGGFHVWNSQTYQELLRVDIARSECNCVAVPSDGKVILTGWADGRIRGYLPQSGKEQWVINEAHLNGVTAIAVRGEQVITGGKLGDICVWSISASRRSLVKSLKDHHNEVSQIKISEDGSEFVTAAHDGSVILWDSAKLLAKQRFMAQSFFNGAAVHPGTGILITVSSDKRIVFWDTFNANVIRELEASINGVPTSVDLGASGKVFVTGGDDKLVKVWDFESGALVKVGRGHCGAVRKAVFSPDQAIIVSVGSEGGIYIWRF